MRLLARLLLSLLIASSVSAVTMDWTVIGDTGNACDPQSQGCFGAVGYQYFIATYEVTYAQYTEFLNAKAASDPLGLYNASMGSSELHGGILRSGSSGSYSYSVMPGRDERPVALVSFYDALRFANWMHNGQGSGDTETGAYTLLGGTATPSNATTVTRNAEATIFLTSEDEWYKAAYYDAASASYFDYPVGSDAPPTCANPGAAPNTANCTDPGDPGGGSPHRSTPVGSYTGSTSPYGIFDMGGNVSEWNEAIIGDSLRGNRGGGFDSDFGGLAAETRSPRCCGAGSNTLSGGFRLAMIPEPGTGLLVIAGLLGLSSWRRRLVPTATAAGVDSGVPTGRAGICAYR